MKSKATGDLGERLAQDFIKKQGYHIIETNYRCREGEIDIIAIDEDYLAFIEVKTRRSPRFGSPEESITPAKKKRLSTVAMQYIQTHDNLPLLLRIDVVAIELNHEGKISRIELIKNAVGEG